MTNVADRSMSLALRGITRISGSDTLDKIKGRKPMELLLYRGTRDGFKAISAAGRTFSPPKKSSGKDGARLKTGSPSGQFDLTPDDEQQFLVEAVSDFAANRLRAIAHESEKGGIHQLSPRRLMRVLTWAASLCESREPARAEALYLQSVHLAAQQALEARSELREAYQAYRSAHDIARHYREEIVPTARLVSEEKLLRYNGMFISVFELLADARAQIASVHGAIEAQRDFWLAEADLQLALVGRPTLTGPGPNEAGSAAAAGPAH